MNAGEETSFLLFVQDELPRLLHIAWLVTGDPHLAEELVQETFERLYMKWRRLRLEDVSAYARRVLINLKVDRWRRSRRESVTRTGELTETVDTDTTMPWWASVTNWCAPWAPFRHGNAPAWCSGTTPT